MMHSLLNIISIILIVLIIREIIKNVRIYGFLKFFHKRVALMYSFLQMDYQKDMNEKALLIPNGNKKYWVRYHSGILNVSGLELNLNEKTGTQLQALYKRMQKAIERESRSIIFRECMIKKMETTENILKDIQQLLDTKMQKGEIA